MNQNRLPRSLILLLFILVAVTFIVGTLRTFASAYAATVDLTQKSDLPSANRNPAPTVTSTADIPSLEPTPTLLPTSILPPPTDIATSMPTPSPTLTPTPIPEPVYIADTTGITALVILLVFVMLAGMAWGVHGHRNQREPKK